MPEPNTVDVVGDSITSASFWNRLAEWKAAGVGVPDGSDVVEDAWLGNRFEDVQDRETARVMDAEHPRPQTLVIALGTNNAVDRSWTAEDEEAFRTLLNTPHPESCVIVSLPAAGPTAPDTTKAEFAKMRPAMIRIAADRPRTVVVDWNDVISAHPEYLRSDGIHFASDHALPNQFANPEAADAYAANLWAGVAQCPS